MKTVRYALGFLALFAGSAACGARYDLVDPLCDPAAYRLDGGLVAHLAEGPGDGTFDYAPNDRVARVEGAYDLSTGEFSWVETRAAGERFSEVQVEGAGTAYPDGDLDVAYTWTGTFAGGRQTARYEVREVRLGCDVARTWSVDDALVAVEEGTLAADGYEWTLEEAFGDAVAVTEGVQAANGSWDATQAVRKDDVEVIWEEGGRANGEITRAYATLSEDGAIDGSVTWSGDNTRELVFTETQAQLRFSWDLTVDLRGNGDGDLDLRTVDGDFSCDVTLDRYDCEASCSGQRIGCEPALAEAVPLTLPVALRAHRADP